MQTDISHCTNEGNKLIVPGIPCVLAYRHIQYKQSRNEDSQSDSADQMRIFTMQETTSEHVTSGPPYGQ